MNTPVTHLSWSSMSTYMQCSLKWKFHYVDEKEPEFTASALLFGQAVHEALGAFLQSRLSGDPLSASNMVDVYRQYWLTHEGPPIKYGCRDSEGSLLEKAQGLLGLFAEQFDPATEVIAIEEPFEADLRSGGNDPWFALPVFRGVIDSIQRVGDEVRLIDYKTAARKPNGDVNAGQLVGYSFGARALGYEADTLDYRYEYLIKSAKPAFVEHPVTIDDKDRRRFLKTIIRVWNAIQSAIFFPNPSYLCGSCGYRTYCDEW